MWWEAPATGAIPEAGRQRSVAVRSTPRGSVLLQRHRCPSLRSTTAPRFTPPPLTTSRKRAAAAAAAEARLRAAGIHLTLGGEPTYVPLEPEGAEWSVCADGPTKLPIAQRLARELQQQVWPGSTLLYCPGKRYEGEVNPRWALRLITGLEGSPPPVRWPEPCQPR